MGKDKRMDIDLNKWMDAKRSGDVLIEHVGSFTSSYIDSVLPTMEQKLHEKVEKENIQKKAFHIFVECAQNLYHHVEPIEAVAAEYGEGNLGAIVMSKEGDYCRITTGNFIHKEKSKSLQAQIDKLNTLNNSEIKNLYRETVNNKQFSDKGGAGLGMIDMARKSGNKLQYQFYTVKDQPDLLFFSFDVNIS